MKRIPQFLIAVLIILAALTTPAIAGDPDITAAQSDALGLDALENAMPDEARDILGGISLRESLSLNALLSQLGQAAGNMLGGIIKNALKGAASIISVALLTALAGSLGCGGGLSGGPDYVVLGGVAAVSIVTVGSAKTFIASAAAALDTLSIFSKALLPCLAAAATASGAFTSAAAKYAASALFMDALVSLGGGVILPLIYAYSAAVIANAAVGNNALDAAVKLIKWVCVTAMSAFGIAFTLYLSLTGVVSGAADEVASRITKTTISAALPVVGSIISDAAGAVTAGAAMLRNAVGIFGLAAVLCVCLAPFLTLGVNYLVYKAAAGVSAAFGPSRLAYVIDGLGSAFGMALSLVGIGAASLFVSIISSMKAIT